jgi:hypothetical protein
MSLKPYIVLLIMVIPYFQFYVYSQEYSELILSNEYEALPKYEVGFSYYSHFRDYQLGGFYESRIDFSGEFGVRIGLPILAGLKLHQSYLYDKDETDKTTRFVLSGILFLRYYLINNLFCESGVGTGYGFYSFNNENGNLVWDWADIRISRFLIASGYDIHMNKDRSLVFRPSVHYSVIREKLPEYPDSPNNHIKKELGFSISAIIQFGTNSIKP